MSTLVDKRIIELEFENKNFEKNLKQSSKSMDELKGSMDFTGTANSINKSFASVDTTTLAAGLSKVSNGFSTMEIVAITAIANITNRVMNLGTALIKSLSVDNIASGWDKYAEKTTSVATIFAQGDNTMEEINEQLEKLAWYTDETSYTFTDMVSNIGKFTASGQGLEDSVQAMMGIANWAALSGQNASTASRAMYQLSQALGTGSVRYEDWKSIQNANMDTKEFRQQALEAAHAAGQLGKTLDGQYVTKKGNIFGINEFTKYLTSDGWFSSDVLMKTLGNYSSAVDEIYSKMQEDGSISTASEAMAKYGYTMDEFGLKAFLAAQEAKTFRDALDSVKDAAGSVWTSMFEQIFGGYDTAKVLWTDLANELYGVFIDGLNVKNEILKGWANLGGRDDLFANTEETTGAFWNLFNAIVSIRDLVSNAWKKVFGWSKLEEESENIKEVSGMLKKLTERFKEFTSKLFLSEKATMSLTDVLTGVFSILKAVFKTIGAVIKGLSPLIEVIKYFLSVVIGVFGKVGAAITKFVDTTSIFTKITEIMQKTLNGIINFFKSLRIIDAARGLVDAFRKSLKLSVGDTDEAIKKQSVFKTIIEAVGNAFRWLADTLGKILGPVIPVVFNALGTALGWIVGKIIVLITLVVDLISKFIEWAKASKFIQAVFNGLKTVIISIGNAFKFLWTSISDFFSSIGKVDTEPAGEFTEDVEKKMSPLAVFLEGLVNLFKGLWSVVKAVLPVISSLFTFLGKGLTWIGNKLKEMFMNDAGKVDFKKIFTVGFWAVIIIGVKRFADTLDAVTGIFRNTFESFANFMDSKTMMNYMEAIKTMAISILLMVGAILILGTMKPADLAKATAALAAMIAMIVTTIKILSSGLKTNYSKMGKLIKINSTGLTGLSAAIIGIGVAILLLTFSIKLLTKEKLGDIAVGLGVIFVLMKSITYMMNNMAETDKKTNKAVKSMVKVAVSLALLVSPIKKIGAMHWKEAVQGLLGIIGIMTVMALFTRMSKTLKVDEKAMMNTMTIAMSVLTLTGVIWLISLMKVGKLIKGLAGVVIILYMMAQFSQAFESIDVDEKAIVNTIGLAFALLIITAPLAIMGKMKWTTIIKGVFGMSLVLLTFSGFAYLINKIKLDAGTVGKVAALSASLIVLSIGLLTFSLAILAIGNINPDKITTALFTTVSVIALLMLISKLMEAISFMGILGVVALSGALVILSIGLVIFAGALLALGSLSWKVLLVGFVAIIGIIGILAGVSLLLTPVIPLMLALAAAILIFSAGIALLVFAFTGLVALSAVSATVFAAALVAMATGIIIATPIIIEALWGLIKGVIELVIRLIKELRDKAPEIVTELIGLVGDVIMALINGIIQYAPGLIMTIWSLLQQGISWLWNWLVGILETVGQWIKNSWETIVQLGKDIIDAIWEGIKNGWTAVKNWFTGIWNSITTFFSGLWDDMVEVGDNMVNGIKQGIDDGWNAMITAIKKFVDMVIQKFKDFFGIQSPSTEMISIADDLLSGLIKGMWDGLGNVTKAIGEWCGKVLKSVGDFFKGAWDKGKDFMNGIGNGAKSVWNGTKNFFSNSADTIKGLFSKTAEEFPKIGKNITDGLSNGIKKGWGAVTDTASKVGNGFVNGFKNLFGIKSPSRVFAEIGKFVDQGLIVGLEKYSDDVYDAGNLVGNSVVDGVEDTRLTSALQSVYDELNSGVDTDMVIRPILDLSEIQNGTKEMNNMMNDEYYLNARNVNAEHNRRNMEVTRRNISATGEYMNNNSNNTNVNTNITNTFNITGSNPKEIANEVSKIIQNNVERNKAAWGR